MTSTSRRSFFRGTTLGLGGLYLSPFIKQLEAATGAAPGLKPARIVFVVQGNGVYENEVQPPSIPRDKEPDKFEDLSFDGHPLGFSLEPLQPHIKRVTLIQGLSGRIAVNSHNTGFAALGMWPSTKNAYGETIDAGMSRNLGGIYRHVGLGVTNNRSSLLYLLTSTARGKALPTVTDPVLAHRQFFAAGLQGDAKKSFDMDTNLLDFLGDDVKRMESRLDGAEKEKLNRYLEAFESMSARQGQLASMGPRISAATPQIDPKLGNWEETKTGPTGIMDRLEAQMDIAAGTLIAGLTNVVTMSVGGGTGKTGIDVWGTEVDSKAEMIPSHHIGHGGSAAGMNASECHAHIRRKVMEKVAHLVTKLEAVPEGQGTMMDNTLIVYFSDAAEGHHPQCRQWPMVTIGNLGGRLKLGNRYLSYPFYGKPGHRTMANFYLSLLQAVGEKKETFGIADSGLLDLDQTGVLNELIV